MLPLYLYEGERFFLHANRGGVKLKQDDTQRFDLFVEQRLEGFPADRLPDSLAAQDRDRAMPVGCQREPDQHHRHPGLQAFLQNVNGWPVDFVGYVGLTAHNDRGLQANGVQLDLFMKAFYSGFPWSDRVKTRLGMGVGLSLAQRAPYIEASNQALGGKPASRMLNYLDPTLDVSLGDLLGSRALKDTFIGFGVLHRSGIFDSSRLLGNVSGGSNYLYTYVESAL